MPASLAAFAGVVLLAALACASAAGSATSTPSPADPTGPVAQTETPPTTPITATPGEAPAEATDEELAQLVAGNTQFAVDLYQRLASSPGNVFMSPYSISTALGMTWGGARAETAEAMAATMHYTLPQERLHAAFERLAAELASRAEDAGAEEEGQRFQLSVANALWPQTDYPFLPEYMAMLAEHYGGAARSLNYMNDPEAARVTINEWVSEQTNRRIPELIPEGLITPLTRLVLTNAIYFNASWMQAFDEESTREGTFHAPGGDVAAQMMTGRVRAGYRTGDGPTVVDLPYLGGNVVMTFVMPAEGELASFEEALTGESLSTLLGSLSHGQVDLTMPKFESGSAMPLKDVLEALGMAIAFDRDRADFSGMTGRNDLYIGAVVHQANITVDESGTEAAAATAVIMQARTSARPEEPPRIDLDRPFLYLIRDTETGAILFMGRLASPAAGE